HDTTAPMSLHDPTDFNVQVAASRLSVNGTLSGPGGVVKIGPGTLAITNSSASNTYTGGTTVENGTLLLVGPNTRAPVLNVGAAGAVVNGGRLIFDYAGGSTPAS